MLRLSLHHHGETVVCCGKMMTAFKSVKNHNMQKIQQSYFFTIKQILCRQICVSAKHSAQVSALERNRHQNIVSDNDMKSEAVTIFKSAVNSVRPRKMIEKVLLYDRIASILKVENKVYHLQRNVFIVGFGKATLGMARAVEDILGEHIISGIISIPRGLPKEMAEEQQFDSLLIETSKIQAYEGSHENQVDESAYNAAKAIEKMISKLTKKDIVIVLSSGGGSVLLPAPHPPITINDLLETNRLLAHHGASAKEMSTVRKNIELLKGGGLVKAAKPAQVLCLALSSTIGDSFDEMAGGPTYPCQPTPRHCLQILHGLDVKDKVPTSVKTFLDRSVQHVDLIQEDEITRQVAKTELESLWEGVQNVIVGNNSLACEAAAKKATELGYLPLILTNKMHGQARKIGALSAKLAKFIMVCYDHKVSIELDSTVASLELDLVMSGLKKQWLNQVITHTDEAHHMNKDICIISGGEMVVNVKGHGVGGKNMESVLGATSQIKSDFFGTNIISSGTQMAFLAAATDGHDGVTNIAGAVIDRDFVAHVVENNHDADSFLDNNDSLTFFQTVNEGRSLVDTKLTGTNVMDMNILLVKSLRN